MSKGLSMNEKVKIATGILLIFLLVVSFWVYTLFSEKINPQETLVERGQRIEEQQEQAGVVDSTKSLAENIISDPKTLKIELNDVSQTEAYGVAYILYNDVGTTYFVSAQLPKLSEGEYYEGWLVKENPEPKYVPGGKLTWLADNEYSLYFESDEELSEYNVAWVTLERDDDGEPEKNMLDGIFK